MKSLYLLIISGLLAILSMLGLLSASAIPDRVTQNQTLVKYDQKCSFDYAIHLRPSVLSGITPVSNYPSQIINSLDFTYRYSQIAGDIEAVSVEAILENPGIWQKTISLMPETATSADFNLPFSLDMTAITSQFDNIEEELKLTDAKRDITIVVKVKSSRGLFIQRLPMKLSGTTLEISNDLTYNQLSCSGSFLYKVNLRPNSAFDTQTLNSPVFDPAFSTLRPGSVVMSKLAEGMEVSLAYDFTADHSVQNLTSNLNISAVIDTSKLWSRTYPVLQTTSQGKTNLYFPLDLAGYLKDLDSLGTEAGMASDSSTIALSADIHTTGQTEFGPIDEVFNPVLKGTLKGNIITWDKDLTKTQAGAIKKTTSVPNTAKYLGLSVSGISFLAAVICAIFVILFGLMVFRTIRHPSSMPPKRPEHLRISKKYGRQIIEASSKTRPENEKIIDLSSIEALAEIADQSGKPIIHQSSPDNKFGHIYYILDGLTRYQYAILETDQPVKTEDTRGDKPE